MVGKRLSSSQEQGLGTLGRRQLFNSHESNAQFPSLRTQSNSEPILRTLLNNAKCPAVTAGVRSS